MEATKTEAANTSNDKDLTDSPSQPRVRISDVAETVNNDTSPAASPASRQSILQQPTIGVGQGQDISIQAPHDEDTSITSTHVKEVHDRQNMLFTAYSDNRMKEKSYHVTDFAGLYPVWLIIEFSMAPTGEAKEDRMNSFVKCIAALFGEIFFVNDTAKIATISITKEESKYIATKANLPSNFTKLRQYIMISGSSWVFIKKAKGSNDIYAQFRLKSQVETGNIVNQVSFEFSRLGGKNLQKKQHQAMETETPLMLLFSSNGTNQASIISDTKQMLDTALEDIKEHGILP